MRSYRSTAIANRRPAERVMDAAFGTPRSDLFVLGNEPKNHQRMLPVRLESPPM